MKRWRHRRNTDPKFDVVIVSEFQWDGHDWITFAYAEPGDGWVLGPTPEVWRADDFRDSWREVTS